ncbi:hypothetical protein, partial [Methyloglobulus morosus]|uniref:hypothetical protein n=1 Tax=Methyloglobulus morosus TaxID=1410681 RepID=UPI001F3FFF38
HQCFLKMDKCHTLIAHHPRVDWPTFFLLPFPSDKHITYSKVRALLNTANIGTICGPFVALPPAFMQAVT